MRRFCRFTLFLLAAALFGGAFDVAQAADGDRGEGILLDQSRRLHFNPVDAFFLVSFDDGPTKRVPATMLPQPSDGSSGDDFAMRSAGVRLLPPAGAQRVTFSTIFIGPGGRIEFVPPESADLSDPRLAERSNDKLRDELLQRKAVLGSWRMQSQAQEESLKRLRADAEVIGDFGRILDKKEEIEKTKSDIASVKKDIENLEHFLKLAKGRPAPLNQVGREAQLVGQLSEITQVSRAAELTELRRKAGAEAELQRKLAVIESTRGFDLEALESELAKARRQSASPAAAAESAGAE